ncbi:PhzF family phenazine biosynthesis protein [Modicisalibacter luteus]|uniref:PhzF family phenazine biosynthesis protein n=1 Tax=Modicisalibacter luteus TaxID=453962 RepID=A0ABV7LY86_9GAMM|nr:PhzF family phenazine biosynthesis protein [Halomonas lutea]GHB10339.1 phenazine biosynthesis protein PhzF [Halomonas lutea]
MNHHPADYYLLDVFTDRAFTGNPLAVFPFAHGWGTARMQAIANELNLSETVFVGEATGASRFPISIFTPTSELPFAGHPTVGTAHLLAHLDMARRDQPLILEAGVGPLEVRFDGSLACFKTAQPATVSESGLDRTAAASLLGLSKAEILDEPVLASCGLPYHLIELASLDALTNAVPNPSDWSRWVAPSGHEAIYLYVNQSITCAGRTLRSRMFSMENSLREDAATGSAASALVGMLTLRESGQGKWQWRIEQGVEMGRPSIIHGEAERDATHLTAIRIAGQAVLVGQGTLYR